MAKVLPVTEKDLIARLLEKQADQFHDAAKAVYASQPLATGDAAYFLRLMAIELYFKLIYLVDTESLIFGHDLREIYDLMPRNSRRVVYANFIEHSDEELDLEAFRGWMKYLSGLFVQIRYPFEEFREMPLEEYQAKLKRFEKADADDFSDASIIYHATRVEALMTAVRSYLGKDRKAAPSP